jgi:hypothetical protein
VGSIPAGNDHLSKKSNQSTVGFFLQMSAILYSCYPSAKCNVFKTGMLGAFFKDMKSSFTLLLVLTAATAFFVVQPVKAGHVVQGGPTFVSVPDGGSTVSLLGFALLGVAALRRKLSRYVVFENLRFGADPGSGRPVSVATLP